MMTFVLLVPYAATSAFGWLSRRAIEAPAMRLAHAWMRRW
jgi:hypothetical protein